MKSEIPNITGYFQCICWNNVYSTGAFRSGDGGFQPDSAPGATMNNKFKNMDFSASRSSNRYGNYTEVNPLYNSCKFFIKY